jgi:hypothetical protein
VAVFHSRLAAAEQQRQKQEQQQQQQRITLQATHLRRSLLMRPNQRVSQAEDVASKLSSLVRSPRVVQLLQGPLPTQPTAAQQAVLASCSSGLLQLLRALPEPPDNTADTAATIQVLSGVLRHQAVHSTGVLLSWLQRCAATQCSLAACNMFGMLALMCC